jgi:hypothetical protein
MYRTSLVLENDRLHSAADILAAEWWIFFMMRYGAKQAYFFRPYGS